MAQKRWTKSEILFLISVWGDSKIQSELDGAVRNKSIYQTISKKLQEAGYSKDWKQCKDKIKNLKQEYKKAKAHKNKTGNGMKHFRYYNELNEVLGNRAAITPPVLLESATLGGDDQQSESEDETAASDDESNVQETDVFDSPDINEEDVVQNTTEGVNETCSSGTSASNEISIDGNSESDVASSKESTPIPSSKPKVKRVKKRSTLEKATAEMMEVFVKYQERSEEKFLKYEEQRRREERQHEQKMMQILMMGVQPSTNPRSQYPYFPTQNLPGNFSYSQPLDMSTYHPQNIRNPQEYFDDEA